MPARGIVIWIRRAVPVLLAALPGLSGCAGPSVEEQASWQCERTPDGRSWSCVERRPGDGIAAAPAEPGAETPDTVAAETAAAGAKAAVPGTGKSAAQPAPAPEPVPKASWSRRLPGLQESQPRMQVENPPVEAPEMASGRPPEPEPALARWESAGAERAGENTVTASPASAPVEAAQPRAPAVSPEVPAPPPLAGRAAASPVETTAAGQPAGDASPGARAGPGVASPQGPYTVQLGAFRSDADAHAYLERHRLDDLGVVLEHRESQGREYSVLTFGHFATVGEATAAWRRIAAGRDLEFWVRPAR